MLEPWREYHATWSYWQDDGVSIAVFVPYDFCVFAYLSLMRVTKHPGATTVLPAMALKLSEGHRTRSKLTQGPIFRS